MSHIKYLCNHNVPFAALKLIAVAILLAGSITNAPAIAIRNATGVVIGAMSSLGRVI